jgi:hypothetical protein
MRREPRAEPQRAHLVATDALMTQPQFDHVRQQLRNRACLDEFDLPRHERRQRLAVDPVFHCSSFSLI